MADELPSESYSPDSPENERPVKSKMRRTVQRRWLPEPDSRNEFPFTVDELVERLKTDDTELAADILKEAEDISDRMVEGRVESVERRSATLQGVVAIAATFVLTGGTLLVSQINGSGWRATCGVLLLVSVASFALCGLRATQAASRWQEWSAPPRQAIFDRPDDGVALGRIAQAAAVLRSAGRNSSLARLKVTLMRMAVWHLQNALVALALLAAVLVAYAIVGPSTGEVRDERSPTTHAPRLIGH